MEFYPEVKNQVNNLGAHEMGRVGFVQARRLGFWWVAPLNYLDD